ncbi:MAG: Crp/Fnr family transcriptional regulator [Alphaproteobacteria bacterium]|nr:Crp/Fnr family transcriptional regulator [Alphaproteobacteria bacterium]
MSSLSTEKLKPFLDKLEAHSSLNRADCAAFEQLPFSFERVAAGSHIAREGDPAATFCGMVSGFSYRYKIVAGGGRQIVSVQVPGDFLDLQSAALGMTVYSVQMMTPGEVATLPAACLERLADRHPDLHRALWRETLVDASIFAEWVTNIGRRDARSRIAHLLCEFAVRLQQCVSPPAPCFLLPMSQEQIADATGLTPVHVNRTLQSMRHSGLIRTQKRQVIIDDWNQLMRVGDFDPAYLVALPPVGLAIPLHQSV